MMSLPILLRFQTLEKTHGQTHHQPAFIFTAFLTLYTQTEPSVNSSVSVVVIITLQFEVQSEYLIFYSSFLCGLQSIYCICGTSAADSLHF